MEMTRISIPISVDERERLRELAKVNLREPKAHARFILRRALFSEPTVENSKPITNSVYEAGMVTGLAINQS